MATFPTLEPGGNTYVVQLWDTGGIAIIVGCPVSPDIATPEFEALLQEFGEKAATLLNTNLATIIRYATNETAVYQMPTT
jgi:hypothetical protein